MGGLEVDATNACVPPSSPLVALFPPLPTTVRGEPCILDGKCGRFNQDQGPMLLYGNGKCVVVRKMTTTQPSSRIQAFVYRGHTARVTCAKFSPSGAYVASADVRGKLRVWSYDNEEHLCKLDIQGMNGPIRGVAWDGDSKRICIVGQTSSSANPCVKVFYWDTGVTCGELGRHQRNRVSSCDFRKKRPMRIVTGGTEDWTVSINGNIPFDFLRKSQEGHERGAIHCLKYVTDDLLVSVGADKRVSYWEGKTLELVRTQEGVHDGTIYSCDVSEEGNKILTAAADGKVNLLDVEHGGVLKTWDVSQEQSVDKNNNKVPFGSMQLGCAFVQGDVPLSVGVNGKIALLRDKEDDDNNGNDRVTFLDGHQYPIEAEAFDHENKQYYTGDSTGIICQWDVATGVATRLQSKLQPDVDLTGKIHNGTITAMEWLSGTLVSVGWDDVIRLSNTDEGASYKKMKLPSQPNAMAKGNTLLVIVMVSGVALFQHGEIVLQRLDLSFEPVAAAVSPNDDVVCLAGTDKVIYVYEFSSDSTLRHVKSIQHHLKEIHSLRFSPDVTKLASADVRDVCVWDTTSWEPLIGPNRWCFHAQKITKLAWSPNGEVLASAGVDDNIFLWSLKKKMKRVNYRFCHRGGITGLIWQSDAILSSVGNDGCICEWDVSGDVKEKFG